MSYYCESCGKVHDELPMDLAYRLPPSVLKIPPVERLARVRMNADFCAIDNSVYIIRGVFEFPVLEMDDTFRWGAWVIVDAWSFQHYRKIFDVRDVSKEPPMMGTLDGDLRDFLKSMSLPVKIHLQNDGLRPRFVPVNNRHPVAVAQSQGITMNDVHHFFRDIL